MVARGTLLVWGHDWFGGNVTTLQAMTGQEPPPPQSHVAAVPRRGYNMPWDERFRKWVRVLDNGV